MATQVRLWQFRSLYTGVINNNNNKDGFIPFRSSTQHGRNSTIQLCFNEIYFNNAGTAHPIVHALKQQNLEKHFSFLEVAALYSNSLLLEMPIFVIYICAR